MHPVVVVGAGISGIACARTLTAAGLPVRVLDRAGRAGGRMATIGMTSAEHAGRAVDVGASYFTVSDPRFDAVVADWQRRGLARPWTDAFDIHGPSAERSTGPLRWAAGAGLRGLVADLADTAHLAVERVAVDLVAAGPAGLIVAGQPAAAVVLAMPDPQARAILHPALARERAALCARFEPVLVLSAGWPSRDWPAFDGMFVNGDERLSWIADDGSRRGDGAPVLVAHSTTSWAAERPEHAEAELLRALRAVLGITSEPTWTDLRRWDCAKPATGRAAGFQLWPSRISACGDGWAQRPRVEAAYLSGVRLGTALAGQLTAGSG